MAGTGTQKKRRRRSTGGSYGPGHESYYSSGQRTERQEDGTSGATGSFSPAFHTMDKSQFKGLPIDDKLVTMFEAITEIGSVQGRIQTVETEVCNLNSKYEAHNSRIKLLVYKSIDLEARSRRNNLIFRGHPENVENDDCASIIRNFLDMNLNLDPNVCIQRAHRLGAINRRNRARGGRPDRAQPRPIIVNFRDYEVVELILQNAHKLTIIAFWINRDYPREIIEARTKLWPRYKKAKGENPRGTVFFGYPAK